jgi:hypothetical protein
VLAMSYRTPGAEVLTPSPRRFSPAHRRLPAASAALA